MMQEGSVDDLNKTNVVLSKTIDNLIDLFEHSLNQNFNSSCVKIYNKFTKYLEKFYSGKLITSPTSPSSPVTVALKSSNQLNRTTSQVTADQHEIRKNLFDFLLRLRSDENQQLYIISKNDHKKIKISKYLVLSMKCIFKENL